MKKPLAAISVCRQGRAEGCVRRRTHFGWLATSIACWGMIGSACATPDWHDTWKKKLAALDADGPADETAGPIVEKEPTSPSDVERASLEQPTAAPAEAIDSGPSELPQSLALEEILFYALENHPLLAARRHEIDVARAELITAGVAPNPQLVMDAEGAVDGDGPADLSARLEFTIPTAGKRRFAMAVARAGIRRAEYALGEETDRIVAAAAEAALEVLYLQELAGLQSQVERLARQAAEIQRGRLEQGIITEIDSLGAEVDAVDVESDRLATVTRLESARLRLARSMGLAVPRPLEVTGSLTVELIPPIPLETVLDVARHSRPELARADADVGRRRHELALSKAQAVPDIQIGPRYAESFDDPDDSAGMRFSTDLPIFDVNQGGICASAAELRRAGAMFDVVRITTLNDVAGAYVQLAPIESRLTYFDQYVVPLTDRAEQAIKEAQASNVIDPVQLSQQLRTLTRLRLNHLELRYLHTRIRTRLELLLGRRLADLESHTNPAPVGPETLPSPAAEVHQADSDAAAPKKPVFRR